MLDEKAANYGFRYWGNVAREEFHLSLLDM
jgi:hypothetical protein